jgi:hypothetical protein
MTAAYEQVQKKREDIRLAGDALIAASNTLNHQIRKIEEMCKDINITVMGPMITEGAGDGLRIGYARVRNKGWRIVVAKTYVNDDGSTVTDADLQPLVDCPRAIRCLALHKCPALVEMLITKAHEYIADINEATEVASW